VCLTVTVQAVVGSIVREKELRLREGMRILGLSVSMQPGGAVWHQQHRVSSCAASCPPVLHCPGLLASCPAQEGAYWWSWSVTHWATLAASGLLCAGVGLYPFRHSALLLMLAFYWLFAAALISFSYFLSTLFSASRVAGTATQFIYALSMMPG
jgi:ATP-binding cassette subfamily A (ABC1) protein 1/ATP-binding cassette subfamily A (ABC1) protein 3